MNSQPTVYRTATDRIGVTGEQLAKMVKREQRLYVVAWFYENYGSSDDVSIHNTVGEHPSDYRRDSRPRRLASDDLYEEFRFYVPENYLDEIVEVMKYDDRPIWAQRSGDEIQPDPEDVFDRLEKILPEIEGNFQPRLDDAWARRIRDEIDAEGEEIAVDLTQPPGPLHGMLGHNRGPQTPEVDDDEPAADLDDRLEEVQREIEGARDEVKGAIEDIRNELQTDHPFGWSIAGATKVLKTFSMAVPVILGTRAVEAVGESAFAKLAEGYPGLQERVLRFLERVVDWLEYVTFPG